MAIRDLYTSPIISKNTNRADNLQILDSGGEIDLHAGRLTWNIIIEVGKIIFLSKWVI